MYDKQVFPFWTLQFQRRLMSSLIWDCVALTLDNQYHDYQWPNVKGAKAPESMAMV